MSSAPIPGTSQVIEILPASEGAGRLVIVRETTLCGRSHLLLRQESYQPGVGWYAQGQVPIDPQQLRGLKALLTAPVVRDSVRPRSLGRGGEKHFGSGPNTLRIAR
ncbi:MAG: hypothetical protein AAF664_03235 [Planctomycetota bacterium]